jgi:hypothetical protein
VTFCLREEVRAALESDRARPTEGTSRKCDRQDLETSTRFETYDTQIETPADTSSRKARLDQSHVLQLDAEQHSRRDLADVEACDSTMCSES